MDNSVKILVVDDEPLIRDVLTFSLIKEGYKVLSVEDGEQALEIIKRENFDMIISDIIMPFVSGYELLKLLKDENNKPPILMLTSLNSEDAKRKAIELGADDFLSKPFKSRELLMRIKALLKSKA